MTLNISASIIRNTLIEELGRDLIGPHDEEEILTERPTVQYLAGILYPSGTSLDPEEDDEIALDAVTEEEPSPETLTASQTMNQTSIGLTFSLANDVASFVIEVSFGVYSQNQDSEWVRTPIREATNIRVADGSGECEIANGATLHWIIREDISRNVSVFLVNRNTPPQDSFINDQLCLFQPQIEIIGDGYSFVHRSPGADSPPDSDLESANLLYRNALEFGIGHGCAVHWDQAQVSNQRVSRLYTRLIPAYELPAIIPLVTQDLQDSLNMNALAEADNANEIREMLQPLLDAYEAWIDQQIERIPGLPERYQGTAHIHMERCAEALNRMSAGLELLERDPQTFEAFRFANRAMLLQRTYGTWAKDFRRTAQRNGTRPPRNAMSVHAWRPFQIAFILMNLSGVSYAGHRISPDSPVERDLVDLLWFPTGGGKTEAYLGLAAYVIGLRRLRGNVDGFVGDGGVTVIMRYTLRLLTIQQFQRAATLICACEYLRRMAPETWGSRPFQIGLWVGRAATPNTISGEGGAEEAIRILRNGGDVNEGNPLQLPSCPWCGEDLTAWNYHVDLAQQRLFITCSRPECDFHGNSRSTEGALPVVIIDDEIYHQCPTLLIATADKFARLPWKPHTSALFGRVEGYCPRHGYLTAYELSRHPASHRRAGQLPPVQVERTSQFLPPELIIQDELHLISGPLGTLAGLYETAIDYLCSRRSSDGNMIRPKIVASTATIRRASDQIQSLFARDSRLFPPPGLDAGYSFFAEQQSLEQRAGRTYIGIYVPGRSVKTALVRVYALLLQSSIEQWHQYGIIADPYTTLVGYFNSLRELGGALRLVEDDIVQRLEYLGHWRNTQVREIDTENAELTSRVPSKKIPQILALLEKEMGSQGAIDVLLATNMISVGVDVDRLGLMVVNGQPKTSTEYIQATSRVGRAHDKPGLVVSVYNWTRPRDLSHYEQFLPYHEALYRHVEATSVTPFAPRARDKALHAILIALTRLQLSNWAADSAAGQFSRQHEVVQDACQYILDRVHTIDQEVVDDVRQELDLVLDWWQQQATQHGADLRYHGNTMYPDSSVPVLLRPAERPRTGAERATLNSLREVETESLLYLERQHQD